MFAVLCVAFPAAAQESTEIHGFYQGYRNFDFGTGVDEFDIPGAKLNGGGFQLVYNLASWFGFWTQFSFYGAAEREFVRVGLFNELQGVRYQTRQYGPFCLYGKGGIGFTRFSVDILGSSLTDYKMSFAYGGGVQIWMGDRFGVVLDASHLVTGLPNLTDLPGREKWDSGLVVTTSLAFRF